MSKISKIFSISVMLLFCVSGFAQNSIIYFGGNIITMEGDKPQYTEAVVTQNDKIVFVGKKAEALKKFANSTKNDLKGKTLLPGFIDPHIHPIVGGMILQMTFISPYDWNFPWGKRPAITNRKDLITSIVAADKELKDPNQSLFLWGYQEPIQGHVDRATLDSINSKRPIIMLQFSQHEGFLNSGAIAKYGVDTPAIISDPQVAIKSGKFMEAAWFNYVVPKMGGELQSDVVMGDALNKLGQLIEMGGVTTIGDMATGTTGDIDHEIKLQKLAYDHDKNPFRMMFVPDCKTLSEVNKGDLDKVYQKILAMQKLNTKHIVVGNKIKLFADGAFFAQNMQVLPPGYNDGHDGQWIMTPEELDKSMKFWWNKDYTIHIHCNGSLGLEEILKEGELLQKTHPIHKNVRLSIEHFGQSNVDQIPRLKKLNGMVSANAYYIYSMGDIYSDPNVLGSERASQFVRAGDLKKYGVPYTFHSDYNMAPIEPLLFVWIAANRITNKGNLMAPQERISVYDGLKAVTIGGAYNLEMEDKIGSIKIGKKADFVILQQDPLKVDKVKVKDISVVGTVFEGQYFDNPVNNYKK